MNPTASQDLESDIQTAAAQLRAAPGNAAQRAIYAVLARILLFMLDLALYAEAEAAAREAAAKAATPARAPARAATAASKILRPAETQASPACAIPAKAARAETTTCPRVRDPSRREHRGGQTRVHPPDARPTRTRFFENLPHPHPTLHALFVTTP